ncbi:MAG: putative metal-dependent HD superfamily phosphohydrolase [Cellvibrionaceae bacterium]|jgi:predicted metal-dependent HD superfamily phosphohydrolase
MAEMSAGQLSVKKRWFELTSHFFTDEMADLLWGELEAWYSEPHRAYHNLEHIADCFAKLEPVTDLVHNRLPLELAIFYHDVIYDPKAKGGKNEQDSADFAAESLSRAGLPDSEIAPVYHFILDTQHQQVSPTADGRLLVDIDLTILGADEVRFWRYEAEIREEYKWVEEQAYRAGRRNIMQGFLEREKIYQTSYFYERYEEAARKNLSELINYLG